MRYNEQYFNVNEIYEYLRKSRSDDPLMSVEEVLIKHENILDQYARNHFGEPIPENNIFREIASSETIDGRPEMLRLLKLIESPQIKAILVVDVQRLSRGDLEDAGRLIKLLRYTNTQVITPQKIYNLNDEYDRDIFERELKRGNEYLEYFKKIQSRGRLESVREGNYIGSVPPYGYDKIIIKEGNEKIPTLQINEEEAQVVRIIFDLYVNKDMGTTCIAKRLEELGFAAPKSPHWSPASIRGILSNEHYIGKVRWNHRKTVRVVENQTIKSTRPRFKEHMICEGKHDPIISDDLFLRASEKRNRNSHCKATVKIRNPFASILYCSCGRAITLRTYKHPDGSTRSAPRLICDNQIYCNSGSILLSDMTDKVCRILEDCIEEFTVKMKNENHTEIKLHQGIIRNLQKKLDELNKKELLQWEAQSDPDPDVRMPQAVFKALNAKLQSEKATITAALEKAYASVPEVIDYEEKIARFSTALTALKDPNVAPDIKNKYLKNIIQKIICKRERPVRLSTKNRSEYGIDKLNSGGNWYSTDFELTIIFK